MVYWWCKQQGSFFVNHLSIFMALWKSISGCINNLHLPGCFMLIYIWGHRLMSINDYWFCQGLDGFDGHPLHGTEYYLMSFCPGRIIHYFLDEINQSDNSAWMFREIEMKQVTLWSPQKTSGSLIMSERFSKLVASHEFWRDTIKMKKFLTVWLLHY